MQLQVPVEITQQIEADHQALPISRIREVAVEHDYRVSKDKCYTINAYHYAGWVEYTWLDDHKTVHETETLEQAKLGISEHGEDLFKLERASLAVQHATNELDQAIANLLNGPHRITEADLARITGSSTTSIREILNRLARQGLITSRGD